MLANMQHDVNPLVTIGILLLTVLVGWMGRDEWKQKKSNQCPEDVRKAMKHIKNEVRDLSEQLEGVHKGWNARRETEKIAQAIHEVDLVVRDIKVMVDKI